MIILRNGENVSPEELELLISDIKGVKEAIVFQKEQKIVASINPDNNFSEANREKTKNYFKQQLIEINRNLPVYKRISDIEISDREFEKTTTKKIIRAVPN